MVEANHAAPARGNHTSEVRRESPAADRWHKSSDAIFYGVLHAFHGHRQKGINVISLDGECYTAAAARLDCDAAFMDRTPAHSSPMTHKAFQPFCLFYHTQYHMVCQKRRPLCSQFASGHYKMVVAQKKKNHGRPPFTGPSLEKGKHMSLLWLFRMRSS